MSADGEIPQPSRVVLRMEFDDGGFREFTVHQPRKVTLDVSSPLHFPGAGTSPYQIMPDKVPHVEITMDAGPGRPVDVRDSRFAGTAREKPAAEFEEREVGQELARFLQRQQARGEGS